MALKALQTLDRYFRTQDNRNKMSRNVSTTQQDMLAKRNHYYRYALFCELGVEDAILLLKFLRIIVANFTFTNFVLRVYCLCTGSAWFG